MSYSLPRQDLDLSLLNEIADGSKDFIIESIDLFLQQTPGLLQLIGDSISQKEWEAASSAAHKLKPNLGFFGMLNSQELMEDVELNCKKGGKNPQAIAEKFNQVKTIVGTNMVTLAQLKADTASRL